MTQYYCTLFDKNYASRGLALYHSLVEQSPQAHLYIFALDKETQDCLEQLKLRNATIIPLSDLEDPELLRIKRTRSLVEYYWTLTPSTVLYCMQKFSCDVCTYLDADIFFFSDPSILLREFDEKDVMITEHRFSEKYKEYIINGIYNVQFVVFRNNENGLNVLNWWRDQCIEWCSATAEDGKFGDQKYLDDWPQRFPRVHVLEHLGGGVAPWNAQQYMFFTEDATKGSSSEVRPCGKSLDSQTTFKVVFYHFHNFKILNVGVARALFYDLSDEAIMYVYQPYLERLLKTQQQLVALNSIFKINGITLVQEGPADVIASLKSRVSKGTRYIIFNRDTFGRWCESVGKESSPGIKVWMSRVRNKLKSALSI